MCAIFMAQECKPSAYEDIPRQCQHAACLPQPGPGHLECGAPVLPAIDLTDTFPTSEKLEFVNSSITPVVPACLGLYAIPMVIQLYRSPDMGL